MLYSLCVFSTFRLDSDDCFTLPIHHLLDSGAHYEQYRSNKIHTIKFFYATAANKPTTLSRNCNIRFCTNRPDWCIIVYTHQNITPRGYWNTLKTPQAHDEIFFSIKSLLIWWTSCNVKLYFVYSERIKE